MAHHLTGAVALAVAVLVFAAGCALDPALVTTDVEAAVRGAVLPILVEGVSCPDVGALDPSIGGSFSCSGMVDGDEVNLVGILGTATESTVDVDVVLTTPLLNVSDVERATSARLNSELGDNPNLRCAVAYVVVSPGREFSCRLDRSSGPSRDVTVTIVDAEGGWEIDLRP